MGLPDFHPEVGQLVEEKSFEPGYRGAWFRCKINEVCGKGYRMKIALEYCDFPEEEPHSAMLYKKPNRSKNAKMELMFRPHYPTIYRENELPDISTISKAVVALTDAWKVGDLVDWWCDGCYWSGTLVEALEDGKFKIHLLPPPAGEGSFYDASCKDLRPSLDWTPEHGWTLPIPTGMKNCSPCARIIEPMNRVAEMRKLCLTMGLLAELIATSL
ncbi:hypothetical protein Tsubulata_038430 [Turnera subulata]|uniref:Agenet domain-containing protein n=1 Tax=Turnera subulata TaxID=218843 RepID=A0A9Q0JQP9_9ROSI|nr:hypothetical protein Tsubulata_038430 [Turnera subulata]